MKRQLEMTVDEPPKETDLEASVRVDSHAAVRAAPILDGDGHSDAGEARWSRARATREVEISRSKNHSSRRRST